MKRSYGFSLVELMVAMVIGLIIILGAGQLFLTVFQTNRQVETLSEKQAAVNFAVETLIRDVRRADWTVPAGGADLAVKVPNRSDCPGAAGTLVTKTYSLASSGNNHLLQVDCDGGGSQEIVGGFAESGFSVSPVGNYGVLITFTLLPTDEGAGSPESLSFLAVNRTAAVGGNGG
ncbi:prepilin-type N-terminal cleavage/methylation domain-containing protein [Halomonas urmiana]|uniref:Prepilin-type N-terminal cleavage/methylation domain-containing protein n=1 Tax=Halomonas urmiana TaxID=490901 RepID=A0A5R8MFT2_9GAMM|nr:type II secretion system protein [Halomonas urmiana]TLF49573.1 prepilin-type N-terminal cleavage/methylation domain-containing protein [Halomonas urmiana]